MTRNHIKPPAPTFRLHLFESLLKEHRALWMTGLFLVALAVRTVVCVRYGDTNPRTANIWEYGEIAVSWLKHGRMVGSIVFPGGAEYLYPTAFMPPLYIFVWMALFHLFGQSAVALGIALLINVILGALCAVLTAQVAERLFPSTLISLFAGLWIAIHPVFVFSSATYHAINLYLVLFLWLFLLVTKTGEQSYRHAALIGLVFGAGILARTEYLMLGGAIVAAGYFIHRSWKRVALSCLLAGLVIAPWTARNFVVMGSFIPVTDSAAYALFKGFNPLANGSGHWVDEHQIAQQLLGTEFRAVPPSPHYEMDVERVYAKAVREFLIQHPWRAFVELPPIKLALFWFFDAHDPTTHGLLYQLALWTLMIPAAIGLFLAGKTLAADPVHRVVLAMFLAQSVVMICYAVHARYRMNVEPFLTAYAAYAIWLLAETRLRRT